MKVMGLAEARDVCAQYFSVYVLSSSLLPQWLTVRRMSSGSAVATSWITSGRPILHSYTWQYDFQIVIRRGTGVTTLERPYGDLCWFEFASMFQEACLERSKHRPGNVRLNFTS